jgi:transcription-repair coupling factor (superfamily II helicase)
MQFTIPPDVLGEKSLLLTGSFAGGRDGLVSRLLDAGFARCDQVEGVCTFAVRGGLVDLFSPACEDPVRVEFWGEEIDSIASFSTETQRRIQLIDELMIPPAREAIIALEALIAI